MEKDVIFLFGREIIQKTDNGIDWEKGWQGWAFKENGDMIVDFTKVLFIKYKYLRDELINEVERELNFLIKEYEIIDKIGEPIPKKYKETLIEQEII